MGKASEIWKEIKPKVGEMLMAVNDIETQAEKAQEEAYQRGYETAKHKCNIQAEKDLREVGERHYQKGLSDAWEAARKIAVSVPLGGMSQLAIKRMFGVEWQYVLMNCTPAKVIEKLRQREQEKKEIQVGDVVRVKNAPEVEIWVTYISDEDGGLLSGLALKTVDDNCDMGDAYVNRNIYNFERTGKHYDVPTVLKKMRGEKDG